MAKIWTTLNGRTQIIIGLERALDIASTDSRAITGVICLDVISGNTWVADIQHVNPIKNSKIAWKILLKKDKSMRDKNMFLLPA